MAILYKLGPLKINHNNMKASIKFIMFYAISLFFVSGCSRNNPNLRVQSQLIEGWIFRQAGEPEWLPATVPGTVHTDLINNGKIDDPYFRLNEREVQ